MKILQLVAENIKRISVVEITPDGNLVQITGKNGSGKTSCLDAIFWALAGSEHIQSKPIRKGAESARVELKLGDGKAPTLIVERRFTESASYLTVKTAEGAKYPSPQKMLDDLLGALTFDPLAFMRQDARGQFDVLRRLVKLDVDLDALDGATKGDFEARTVFNRDAKAKRAQAAAIVVAPDAPEKPIDESALLDAIQAAADGNAKIEQRKTRRAEHGGRIGRLLDEAAQHRKDAEESEISAIAAEGQAKELQAELDNAPPLPEPTDIATLRADVNRAKAVNAQISARDRRAAIDGEAKALEDKAAALTAAMEARKAQKQGAIAKAQMPVPGLAFGDGVLLYNDLPLDQASDAEQLIVSTAIAAALNPKLRVLRIRDGSLLDDDAMVRLGEFANERNMQVWVERVDSSGAVGIVMEDGHVKGAQPEVVAAQ